MFIVLAQKPIIIVSDIRRRTDVDYFKANHNIKTIRIEAGTKVREQRGWQFEDGVDNVQSECDLDNFEDWDFQINNDGTGNIKIFLMRLVDVVHKELLRSA